MEGELILVFFLIRYLRKSLRDSPPYKKWDKLFLWSMYVLPVLLVLEITVIPHVVSFWLGYIILFTIIYITYSLRELRTVRNIMIAFVPFIIVSFVKDVTEKWFPVISNRIELYMDIIFPCSIVWMIAMLITYGRQQDALKKERAKREKEEEQNRLMAIKKDELEEMVTKRTSELMQQKAELEQTLSELKETQTQLIQKEKMASLGELTAGIAHEIQNPLNFVNNFSEVNKELIEEMETEIEKGNFDEVKAIADDIRENELKINHHGKRADAIVKGMLQHSRASSGKKEPTDINALADEYLRLSYHGLRAKDKTFNATFKTNFDESIGKIEVIPQDIGRVILNLLNNAFFSVNEKKKILNGTYEPTVSVSTKKVSLSSGEPGIEITVRDNGSGILQKVQDKIFQPFFTTKAAGEGTGLGLSLSYDIVTKAHGGELKAETKDGEFAEFVITLPKN